MCASCGNNCLGNCSLDLTGIGQVGATGAQGGYGGYSSRWTFSTTTTSGTTAGQLRFNSGTYASVTTMYINKTNKDSTDLSNFLATLSNGTYYGKVRIFKESDSSKFWEGTITAVSSGATEYTLTVSYILANSTFSASDSVVLSFTPHGLGAKPILYSAGGFVLSSATVGSWVSPGSETEFTLPAGVLLTNGDYIEIILRGVMAGGGALTLDGVRGVINTDSYGSANSSYALMTGTELLHHSGVQGDEFEMKITVERYDDTNVLVNYTCIFNNRQYLTGATTFPGAVNSLTNSSNDFSFEIYQEASSDVVTFSNIKVIKYLQ